MKNYLLPFVCVCGGALGGCSTTPPPAPPPGAVIDSLELFVSRGSLMSTDFEQYSITGRTVFHECGQIERGRFVARDQGVAELSPEAAAALTTAAYEVNAYIAEKAPSLAQPGTNKSPFDPGQFTLKSRVGDSTIEVKTSLDSVVNERTIAEEKLGKLAKLVRGETPSECTRGAFYGLGKDGAKR